MLVVCLEEFIIGRVIKAMNSSWHPNCFLCELCDAPLADAGFIKSAGRSLLSDDFLSVDSNQLGFLQPPV